MENNKKQTGALEVKVDLAGERNPKQSDKLPRERDESTGAADHSDENETQREDIHSAYEDIRQGLRDTDLRGVTSDIKKADTP